LSGQRLKKVIGSLTPGDVIQVYPSQHGVLARLKTGFLLSFFFAAEASQPQDWSFSLHLEAVGIYPTLRPSFLFGNQDEAC